GRAPGAAAPPPAGDARLGAHSRDGGRGGPQHRRSPPAPPRRRAAQGPAGPHRGPGDELHREHALRLHPPRGFRHLDHREPGVDA
ncbi:MAG: hypothetical protein AVDCRST_MAG88-163, partial [uncultured Thermomicrobiales bacterium]